LPSLAFELFMPLLVGLETFSSSETSTHALEEEEFERGACLAQEENLMI
jgi:hypothetical protein